MRQRGRQMVHRALDALYLRMPPRTETGWPGRQASEALIVSIACHNASAVQLQLEYAERYLPAGVTIAVADNSATDAAADRIADVCQRKKTPYLRLPSSRWRNKDPSASHGLALTWIYRRRLAACGASIIGSLDHDVFPVKPVDLVAAMQGYWAYGLRQERSTSWYLWPGFCFFVRERVAARALNFMPGNGRDTGGGNWEVLFAGSGAQGIRWASCRTVPLRDGASLQRDMVQVIDDAWLHTVCASGWTDTGDKDALVRAWLARQALPR